MSIASRVSRMTAAQRRRRGGAPDTVAPTVPANLRVVGTPTLSEIAIAWDASTDDVGVVGYELQRAPQGGAFATVYSGPVLTHTSTGLAPSGAYRYRVRALDGAGNASAWGPDDVGLAAAVAVPEQHYLPFDGLNDYGLALDAAVGAFDAGVAGEICLVLKVDDSQLVAYQRHAQIWGDGIGDLGCSVLIVYTTDFSTEQNTVLRSWDVTGAGGVNISVRTPSRGGATIASSRVNGTSGRLIMQRGGVAYDVSGVISDTRPASHIILGAAAASSAGAPFLAAGFAAIRLTAAALLTRAPTPQEVADYSADPNDPDPGVARKAGDARAVWPDHIHWYVTGTHTTGTTMTDLVGNKDVTLYGGLSDADKVAL